jgi:hypothetical protein
MSELTRIPSFEQNGDNSPQALLDDLALFDDSIHSRIVGHQMEHMLSGTGMHGKSETAVELGVKALEDHIELIDGYSWAIGLADYSYRDHQDSDFIRAQLLELSLLQSRLMTLSKNLASLFTFPMFLPPASLKSMVNPRICTYLLLPNSMILLLSIT